MVKNHKIRTLVVICFCISLTACSNLKGSDVNTSDVDSSNDNSNSKVFTNVSRSIDEGGYLNDEAPISLKKGLKDESLVAKEKNVNGYGNISVNIKEDNQVLLCKDPVYDIVYYVNYGVDYFIYRIKDGKSELVASMPAKRLFCIDGKLYFILESYAIYALKDMKDGNIFCYDPISGEVERIIDAKADKMFVYKDGIYYVVETGETELGNGAFSIDQELYFYSFTTMKSKKITSNFISLLKWKDYHISEEVKEIDENEAYELYGIRQKIKVIISLKLETLDQSKSIKLTDNQYTRNYSIAGDKFYYIFDRKSFNIYDIETQETKEIPLSVICKNDFTVLNNGMIYIDSLLQITPETGEQSIITPENEYETIYELYTDGENLYGVDGYRYYRAFVRP